MQNFCDFVDLYMELLEGGGGGAVTFNSNAYQGSNIYSSNGGDITGLFITGLGDSYTLTNIMVSKIILSFSFY